MKELAIIYLLPENVSEYYRLLRRRIARAFDLPLNKRVPAHITLKYPFPCQDYPEIERAVQAFCRSQAVTTWTLKDFGYFNNPENDVIFIDAIPSDATRQVHADLLSRLRKIPWVTWSPYDDENIHYHVTLASKIMTPEIFDDVWNFVHMQVQPDFEVNFNNLALVEIDGERIQVTRVYQIWNTP